MPAKAKKAKAPKNQHQLCEPLPADEVLTDLQKKSWKLGNAIGSGGFGLIYLADENSKRKVADTAPYVIKIEPHDNGPLFSEIAFYQRVCKANKIEGWRKRSKSSYVGVPSYIAHGLHNCNGKSLRFMVMPRYGQNLHDLWLNAGKKFKRETVAKIALIMLDSLEYIHNQEYVHADIKGANILCDYEDSAKIFLVDYGLAYRYTVDNDHKKYDPDPKKAHNGTIEYTSTDAHKGANPSRRGDIEILGFMLLHFLSGKLPWEDKLTDCNYVCKEKIKCMSNIDSFVKKTCSLSVPEITHLLQHATELNYDETPNYDKLRNMFKNVLKSMGVSKNSPIDYSSEKSKPKTQKRSSQSDSSPVKKKKSRTLISSTRNSTDDTNLSTDEDFVEKCAPAVGRQRKINKPSSSSQSDNGGNKRKLNRGRNKKPCKSEDAVAETSDVDMYDPPLKCSKITKSTAKRTRSRKLTSSTESDMTTSAEDNKNKKLKSPVMLPLSNKKIPSSRAQKKVSSVVQKLKISPTASSSECISDTCTSQSEISRESTSDEENSPIKENLSEASPGKQKKSLSRHSMAPLHTSTVLTKSDKLTGKFAGKHPVFMRRRKLNVSKATTSTQTTPSLRKTRSRK